MHEILEKIQPALIDIAVAVALAALAFATAWLRAHTRNTRAAGVVDRVTTDIDALVAEQAQVVDSFRGDDGRLDKDEAVRAKDAVMERLKKLLGPAGIGRIVKDVGIDQSMVDSWLSAHVEKSVRGDQTIIPPSEVGRGDATGRTPQGGFIDARVLVAMLCMTMLPMLAMFSCSAIGKEAKAVAASIVDCTKKETAGAVRELRPLGDALLVNALADGKVDFGPVRDVAKGFATDVGRCVLADAVSRALSPKPVDPNAPKLSPLDVDTAALRAGFRQVAADLYGGVKFKTEAGEL